MRRTCAILASLAHTPPIPMHFVAWDYGLCFVPGEVSAASTCHVVAPVFFLNHRPASRTELQVKFAGSALEGASLLELLPRTLWSRLHLNAVIVLAERTWNWNIKSVLAKSTDFTARQFAAAEGTPWHEAIAQ